MAGELGRMVEQLAADFNASQTEYRIVPEHKGQYTETMTAALFAIRTNKHPAIVQVNEVATATMMAAKGATYPVFQLMREQGAAFDPSAYLPAVSGYYTDASGNMLSFPFNASTPILYYNKDQFRIAGLDPEAPPRTWPEVEAAAKKLLAAGVPCGFTTAWPSWINVENLLAVHDQPISTKQNGFGGHDTELVISNDVAVKHLAALAEWQKIEDLRLWRPRGPRGREVSRQPVRHVRIVVGHTPGHSGECQVRGRLRIDAVLAGRSGGAAERDHRRRDPVGAERTARRPNTRAWRGSLPILSRPEVQARWHQASGYLPITRAAYELTRRQGFYERNPGTDISIKQITVKEPTAEHQGAAARLVRAGARSDRGRIGAGDFR